MNLNEIKDLMAQFNQSSLRELSYKNGAEELMFSKNETRNVSEFAQPVQTVHSHQSIEAIAKEQSIESVATNSTPIAEETQIESTVEYQEAEGDLVESPLVGVVYLAAGPDKPYFVSVGDTVKKGQTLVIIEAMKVMNEIPAPKDGIVTEILVTNEEMVEFGKGLVRIK